MADDPGMTPEEELAALAAEPARLSVGEHLQAARDALSGRKRPECPGITRVQLVPGRYGQEARIWAEGVFGTSEFLVDCDGTVTRLDIARELAARFPEEPREAPGGQA